MYRLVGSVTGLGTIFNIVCIFVTLNFDVGFMCFIFFQFTPQAPGELFTLSEALRG
jgi:hypothetical protein